MSIQIIPNGGRYGNQLFPYFLGRILSKELKYKIYGPSLYDINYDYDQSDCYTYENPIEEINDETLNDINSIISNKIPRKIKISGYLQKKEIYIPYRNKIKEWFNFKKYEVSEQNVAMHIRLGDLLYDINHLLPIDYYEKALSMINFNNLSICTDTPEHPMIQYFVKKYNAKIFIGNERKTICFLASHNNLILSQGSFSFWSGFLCDGENVINAIPKTGWNSNKDKNLILFESNCRHIQIL
jgi:hypothetical protein